MFYLTLTTKTFYLFLSTKTFYLLLTTKTFYFSKTTAATYERTHSQKSKPACHPLSCTYTKHTLARVSHSATQQPNAWGWGSCFPAARAHKTTATAILSQSAMRGSHVLACNGVRLTSQLKWRKDSQPGRFIPYIDCAMLSQFFAYCRDSRVGSYNITVLNSYNC